MKYTELTALKTKFLHGNATTFLQKQQYAYNIRGWLTQINNIDGVGTDVFAEKLFYETLPSYYNSHATARFNGNISGMEWYTKDMVSTGMVNGYALNYDDINRLTGSSFFNRNGSTVSWQDSQQPSNLNYGTITGIGSENGITYDKNGNIKTLVRKGKRSSEVVVFDSFTYEYDGNKLLRVRDVIGGQNSLGDFRNTASLAAVNDYDQNGNLIADVDRNMTVLYDRQNLPYVIRFANGRINNTYRNDGMKTGKMVYDANERLTLNERYYGDLVLSNNVPARILHADGVIELSSTFQPTYFYHLKDHLGNVRAVVSPGSNNTTTVNQTNEYYPFGMSYTKSASSLLNPVVPNKYKYNGKEEQEMPGKWLDYGARFYDPQIGRWTTPDPLSEVNRRWSPYRYAYNNPLLFIDPDGMLEDNFYFDENNKLIKYENNDSPDRIFVVHNEPKELDEHGNATGTETKVDEVQMSTDEVEQHMNDNGYKKVTDKEQVEVTEMTTYITDGDGANRETSKNVIAEKVIDKQTMYVDKNAELKDTKDSYQRNLERSMDGTYKIEKNVMKRTYDYNKKDYSSTGIKIAEFISLIFQGFY